MWLWQAPFFRPSFTTVHSQKLLSSLCDAHTVDTLMSEEAQGESPLPQAQAPSHTDQPGSWEAPVHPCSTGSPASSRRHCSNASVSTSPHRTHNASCASKSSTVSAASPPRLRRARTTHEPRRPRRRIHIQRRLDTRNLGLRGHLLPPSSSPSLALHRSVTRKLTGYESFKRTFHNSPPRCRNNGFRVTPVVFDGHAGGWTESAKARVTCTSQRMSANSYGVPDAINLDLPAHLFVTSS